MRKGDMKGCLMQHIPVSGSGCDDCFTGYRWKDRVFSYHLSSVVVHLSRSNFDP